MKLLRFSALAVFVSLAACTASPTNPARTEKAPPSFDGGYVPGSGTDLIGSTSDGGGVIGSGNAASDTTKTERGGNGLGSGN